MPLNLWIGYKHGISSAPTNVNSNIYPIDSRHNGSYNNGGSSDNGRYPTKQCCATVAMVAGACVDGPTNDNSTNHLGAMIQRHIKPCLQTGQRHQP